RIQGPARHRRSAGGILSGAPRARLPGGLYALPGPWAQPPGAPPARPGPAVTLPPLLRPRARVEAFQTPEFLSLQAPPAPPKGEEFGARLAAIAGKKVDRLDIKDEASASAIKAAIEGGAFRVTSVEKKAVRRNPAAPFTTSTLQQEASRKLGFSAKQTMNVA